MRQRPIQVLLVDDDQDDHVMIRDLLAEGTSARYDLDWVSTYAAALEKMRHPSHDVYLVDYRLGEHTGLDLLRQAISTNSKVPTIILTGQGDELLVTEAMHLGAADYMPKGIVSTKALERAIGNVVERAELRQRLEEHRERLAETYNELERRNKEIKSFYHTLAHELRTPLTAAREFVAIILDGIVGQINADQRDCLSSVQALFDQMKQHIDDLLDVARLETGKFTIEQKQTSLAGMVQTVIATLTPASKERGLGLRMTVEPHLPDAFVDEQRIAQVLMNLLGNAMKFTPRGGTVCLSARHDEQIPNRLFLSVTDTGCGIDQADVRRIFDRLYQVQDGHTRMNGGLGLGLYICQALVKLHGSDIVVESEKGKGSSFSFSVPIYIEGDGAAADGHQVAERDTEVAQP